MRGPAPHPCGSCPYRRDVPSGVWSGEEYDKLPPFDNPDESFTVFMCHQADKRLCAGWVGCHDMDNMIGLRLAASAGMLSSEELELARNYVSPVPLFANGAEAAAHGHGEIANPSPAARRTIDKLERRRANLKGA